MMNTDISFAQLVKEELTNNTYSIPRKKALLSAFIKINGVISFKNKKSVVTLKSEFAKIARFIYEGINELFPNIDIHLSFVKTKSKLTYHILINDADQLLDELCISFIENKISRDIVYNDDTISGYLAGAFLVSGSINSPKTSNYHLEIALSEENYAKWFLKLFVKYRKSNILAKMTTRRSKYIVYIKHSVLIVDFLVLIGAVNACMEFENERINRDYINNTNRLDNIDTANMNKTINTAKRQLADIAKIESLKGLGYLKKEKLILVASLRKENESASLEDIANMMSESLKTPISKSNVNHLFRRIHIIAENLQ